MTVVTVSASYGAGGSVIAPRVATRLGVQFVDRAVPVEVARDAGLSVEDAEALAQNTGGGWAEFFSRMATLSYAWAPPLIEQGGVDEAALVARTERHLREVADGAGGVVLGHAGALVLAGRPDALHVRLDGPVDRRVTAAMAQHGIDRETAESAQRENDKIRSGYVTHFYNADSADPQLYDLVIDTTRFAWPQVEEIVVHAAGLGDRVAADVAGPH